MRALVKQYKNLIMMVAVIFLLLITFFNVHTVPTGYTGILVRFGRIERSVQPGELIFTTPFVEQIDYVNNRQRDFHVKTEIGGEAADETPVFVKDITVTYQVASDRSAWIHANVNKVMTENLITSAAKAAMLELPPAELKMKLEAAVLTKLSESLAEKYGSDTVYVRKVTAEAIDFGEEYKAILREKFLALQEQTKAEADKKTAILKAEAEAERIRLVAEAQAEANQKISDSLLKPSITSR